MTPVTVTSCVTMFSWMRAGDSENRTIPKVVVSTVAAAVIVLRQVSPSLFDITDLILIAVIVLPWISSLVRSAEFPGGFKIEFQDVQQAGAKVTGGAGQPTKLTDDRLSFIEVAETDPNLALVGLRIELERRLRDLANKNSINKDQPLMRIFRQLQQQKVLSNPVLSGLHELVIFGNQAAHGARVDPEAASWAMNMGPQILAVLDEQLRT